MASSSTGWKAALRRVPGVAQDAPRSPRAPRRATGGGRGSGGSGRCARGRCPWRRRARRRRPSAGRARRPASSGWQARPAEHASCAAADLHLGDRDAGALGGLAGGGGVDAGQHEHELLPAEAADGVALADDVAQRGGGERERAVALGVAEGVVDALEVVEVDDDDADRPPPSAPASAARRRSWLPRWLSRPVRLSVRTSSRRRSRCRAESYASAAIVAKRSTSSTSASVNGTSAPVR